MAVRTLTDRFWSKVNRNGPTQAHCVELGPCWLWTYGRTGLGYGTFRVRNAMGQLRTHGAHRVAWLLTHGDIPDGQSVLHKCDVRHCVNPAHLYIGTQKQNMQDAATRGRMHVPRPRRQRVPDADVAAIRMLVANGASATWVARRYGVTQSYVSLLLQGKRRQYSPDVAREGAA